jgi:hypothetical protein
MGRTTVTKYFCDRCHKDLPTNRNSMNICTELNGNSIGWSRLHVKIEHRYGSHNDVKTESAGLCRDCTVFILKDALNRIKAGERATRGTEEIKEMGWEND